MAQEYLYLKCKESAQKHKMFFHYTNLESLLYILSSRSFRLSLISLINDPEEENRFDDIKKNKVFLMCFSHHQDESIPLWKIYSKDKFGLRLGFQSIDFFKDIDRYYYLSNNKRIKFPTELWGIRDSSVLDVEYVDDPYSHVDYMDPLDTGAQIPYPINLGIVKRKAWEYEAETRARVYIDVGKGATSRLWETESLECRNPSINYIYCSLKDEELYRMNITFNPFTNKEMKDSIIQEVTSYLPDFNPENFVNSELENKIRM